MLATAAIDKDGEPMSSSTSGYLAPEDDCLSFSLLLPRPAKLSNAPSFASTKPVPTMTRHQGRSKSQIDWSEWQPASAKIQLDWTGNRPVTSTDQDSQVIEYLNKKGYTVTEQHLRREIQESGPDGRPKVKRSEDTGVHKYFQAYSKLGPY